MTTSTWTGLFKSQLTKPIKVGRIETNQEATTSKPTWCQEGGLQTLLEVASYQNCSERDPNSMPHSTRRSPSLNIINPTTNRMTPTPSHVEFTVALQSIQTLVSMKEIK